MHHTHRQASGNFNTSATAAVRAAGGSHIRNEVTNPKAAAHVGTTSLGAVTDVQRITTIEPDGTTTMTISSPGIFTMRVAAGILNLAHGGSMQCPLASNTGSSAEV